MTRPIPCVADAVVDQSRDRRNRTLAASWSRAANSRRLDRRLHHRDLLLVHGVRVGHLLGLQNLQDDFQPDHPGHLAATLGAATAKGSLLASG